MSLDEKAFHFALKTWRRLQKRGVLETAFPQGFSCREQVDSLRTLASALSDRPMAIGFTESWFGWDQERIYCPQTIHISHQFDTNRTFLTLQIAKACIARRSYHVQSKASDHERISFARATFSEIERTSSQQFAGYAALQRQFVDQYRLEQATNIHKLAEASSLQAEILSLWGLGESVERDLDFKEKIEPSILAFLVVPIEPILALKLEASDFSDESYLVSTGKELKFKPNDKVTLVQLPQRPEDESPLVHNFEKLLTTDDYKGGQKPVDGDDQLEDHHEALSDMKLSQIVRSPEATRGILKSDLVINFDIADDQEPELSVRSFRYDEWDYRKKAYIKKWCAVSEIDFVPPPHDALAAAPLTLSTGRLERLKKEFMLVANKRALRRRVRDGHDIDLDAAVDHYVAMATRSQVDDRCDVSRPPQDKDLAVLILLDLSLSTDGWSNNHRIMDLCKEAVRVLGEVLSPFHPLYSIYGFCSHTHRDCRLLKIKSLDENWQIGSQRLSALRPMGYTRIGPAVRHATHLLKQTKAKKKLLVIVGDGKPNDYDQYEGRYGVEDVRQAVFEAEMVGVSTQCIAIDKSAKGSLMTMFRKGNYHLLSSLLSLPEMLSAIFKTALFDR